MKANIQSVTELREAIKEILENLREDYQADVVTFYYYDEPNERLILPVGVNLRQPYRFESWLPSMDRIAGKIVKTGQPVFAEDALQNPDTAGPFVYAEGIRSSVGYPLMTSSDQIIGILFVNYRQLHSFSDSEISSLKETGTKIADTIAGWLEKVPNLKSDLSELAGLLREEAALQEIADAARNALGDVAVAIWTPAREMGELMVIAQSGLDKRIARKASLNQTKSSAILNAYQTVKPEPIQGKAWEGDPFSKKHAQAMRLNIVWAFPVLSPSKTQSLGVLCIYPIGYQELTAREEIIVNAFARQTAATIENQRKIRTLITLNQMGRQLTFRLANPQTLMREIVINATRVMGADSSAIHQYDARRNVFYRFDKSVVYGLDPYNPSKKPRRDGVSEYIIENGLISISDIKKAPQDRMRAPNVVDAGIKAYLGIRMKAGKENVGVLFINYNEKREFSPDEITIAITFANYAAAAIHNSKLYRESLIEAKRLDLVRKIASDITSELDRDLLLQKTLEQSLDLLNADFGSISIFNPATQLLEFQYAVGKSQDKNVKMGQGLIGTAAESRETIRVGDVSKDTRYVNHVDETVSELDVPMMVGKRLVGVLNAESCRINAFSEDDQHFAEVLAAQAATAIRNTHLYESVQAVNEIGQKLTSGIRLKEDEIVNLIYEQTRDLTGAQDMYIALFDEETNLIRFSLATEHGKQVEYDSREADMDKRGKTEEVIFTGQPILHRTQEEAEAWYREPGHKEFIGAVAPSWLGVPMVAGKKKLGIIALSDWEYEYAYDEQDLQVLSSMASQAAIALDNATLFYETNQKLERRVDALSALNEIGQKLTSGIRLKEDEIVNLIYEQTRDLTGAQDMYIALFDEETNLIRFSLATEHGKQVEYDSREADMDKRGKTEEVIFTGQPILHRTQEEAEAWYREPGHKEFIGAVQPSYLGVPMIAGKKKLGIIALSDWEHEYAYDEQDLKVLISMADQAAIALDNARLYYDVNQDLEERLEELETIQDIIRAINSEQDIGELIKRVAQETRALFNADDAVVYQYDQILKEFFQQIKIGEREHRQPQPDGSSLAVIDQGKIVFADDAESHPILGKSSFTRKYGVKSCIAAPLQVADECVGVLFVNYYDKLHHFTKDEKRIMRIIADQAALAIQTAGRLYNTNLQLETVLRSVEGARECKSLDELLQNYLRSALDAIDAESGVVQLLDQESDELVVRAVYGNVLERKYQRIPIDKGVTGRSIQKEEMVYVPDVRKDPDYLDFFPRTRSELAVPLMVKNEPLGVLNAEHSLIDAFDVNKRRLFELFSTQASVMIQERKQLELAQEQRIQSEIEANAAKMTQLMAHNMKNYLGGARSDLDDIIKQIELADDQKGTLERIDASMARCIDITMGLFKPYRPGKVVEQTPLLLVGNAVDHVKQITEISIKNQVPKDLPKIRIEANNAVDFFHEILTNAIKAVRKRIDAGEIQKGFVKIDGKISDTGHVKLLFTNNGPAIPIDQRAKIFERFSGEPDQRDPNNLGLGLWGARTFFKRQGGNVRLLVSDESHTTFEVTIPSVSALGVRQ